MDVADEGMMMMMMKMLEVRLEALSLEMRGIKGLLQQMRSHRPGNGVSSSRSVTDRSSSKHNWGRLHATDDPSVNERECALCGTIQHWNTNGLTDFEPVDLECKQNSVS